MARRKLSRDENSKYIITEEISFLNDKLIKLRKKVEICDDVQKRVQKIDDNLAELDTIADLERETKEKKKSKNKKGKE